MGWVWVIVQCVSTQIRTSLPEEDMKNGMKFRNVRMFKEWKGQSGNMEGKPRCNKKKKKQRANHSDRPTLTLAELKKKPFQCRKTRTCSMLTVLLHLVKEADAVKNSWDSFRIYPESATLGLHLLLTLSFYLPFRAALPSRNIFPFCS